MRRGENTCGNHKKERGNSFQRKCVEMSKESLKRRPPPLKKSQPNMGEINVKPLLFKWVVFYNTEHISIQRQTDKQRERQRRERAKEKERERKKENNTVDWVNYFQEAAFKLIPYSNRNV